MLLILKPFISKLILLTLTLFIPINDAEPSEERLSNNIRIYGTNE